MFYLHLKIPLLGAEEVWRNTREWTEYILPCVGAGDDTWAEWLVW